MSGVATAIAGSAIVGAVVSNRASKRASQAQGDAAQLGVDEQSRQFDAVRSLLMPYVQAGTGGGFMPSTVAGSTPGAVMPGTGFGAISGTPGGLFDAAAYLRANPDVARDRNFRDDPEGHWLEYGRFEGRAKPLTPTTPGTPGGQFDAVAYLRANPDVASDPQFMNDPERHWQEYGRFEGRARPLTEAMPGNLGDQFDAEAYLRDNPDIARNPRYKDDPEAHWREFGQFEGRAMPVKAGPQAAPGGTPDRPQGSLQAQQALIGLLGPQAQADAFAQIEQSPQFAAYLRQGENALLQKASATGGLRGGNIQRALAEFRPNLLSQLIDQQYARLGGLTSLSQNAAAGVGNAGMQTGNNVSQLLQQQGAATAGGILGGANAIGQGLGGLSSAIGYGASQGWFGGGQPAGIKTAGGAGGPVNYSLTSGGVPKLGGTI